MQSDVGTQARVANPQDLDAVTETLAGAFREDPVWSWAFPGGKGLDVLWRFLLQSAMRYRWVWTRDDHSAAAVWIPPDGTELTEHEEQELGPLLEELVGAHAAEVMELFERLDAAHPKDEPHYYLSLLGTHPRRRGHGLGMALLAESLAAIDREGMPAYLESSNPDNDGRYARLGFERVGELTTPDGAHTLSTMWRSAR